MIWWSRWPMPARKRYHWWQPCPSDANRRYRITALLPRMCIVRIISTWRYWKMEARITLFLLTLVWIGLPTTLISILRPIMTATVRWGSCQQCCLCLGFSCWQMGRSVRYLLLLPCLRSSWGCSEVWWNCSHRCLILRFIIRSRHWLRLNYGQSTEIRNSTNQWMEYTWATHQTQASNQITQTSNTNRNITMITNQIRKA